MASAEPKSLQLFKEINNLRRSPSQHSSVSDEKGEFSKLNNTCFADLVRNKKFEVTTLFIIVLNALFIGYDTDYSARWGKPDELYNSDTWGFPVMENAFAIYFTFEVVVRFFAFARWIDLLDAWWIFDSILVLLMVFETYVLAFVASGGGMKQLSVLRLLRLLRITRMGKLMRYFPDLQIILRGMLAAVRSVGCTAILLVLILYVFAIIFTSVFHQGFQDDEEVADLCDERDAQACAEVLFGSLGKAMRHLFIMGTILDDITLCTNTIRGASDWLSMLFVFVTFVVLSSFTMLNMLIGILCEVVQATSEGERLKSTAARIREAIRNLFLNLDKDHNGSISREEFMEMRNDTLVNEALEELRVKPKHFKMYADLMFQAPDGGSEEEVSMSLEKTVDMIMHLRPGSKVNALDMATFSRAIARNHYYINHWISRLEKMASVGNGTPTNGLRHTSWEEEPTGKVLRLGPPRVGKVKTLQDLERVSQHDIISELQTRVGMNTSVSQVLDPHYHFTRMVEAFESLCAPQLDVDDQEWSAETYSC